MVTPLGFYEQGPFQEPFVIRTATRIAPFYDDPEKSIFNLNGGRVDPAGIDLNFICNDDDMAFEYDPFDSQLFYYRLQIFDRWGNLIFDQTVEDNNSLNGEGIIIQNVIWDGTFNGSYVVEGVYVWIATFKSCYSGPNVFLECMDSFEDNGLHTFNNGELTIAGDVTVVH